MLFKVLFFFAISEMLRNKKDHFNFYHLNWHFRILFEISKHEFKHFSKILVSIATGIHQRFPWFAFPKHQFVCGLFQDRQRDTDRPNNVDGSVISAVDRCALRKSEVYKQVDTSRQLGQLRGLADKTKLRTLHVTTDAQVLTNSFSDDSLCFTILLRCSSCFSDFLSLFFHFGHVVPWLLVNSSWQGHQLDSASWLFRHRARTLGPGILTFALWCVELRSQLIAAPCCTSSTLSSATECWLAECRGDHSWLCAPSTCLTWLRVLSTSTLHLCASNDQFFVCESVFGGCSIDDQHRFEHVFEATQQRHYPLWLGRCQRCCVQFWLRAAPNNDLCLSVYVFNTWAPSSITPAFDDFRVLLQFVTCQVCGQYTSHVTFSVHNARAE